MPQVSRFVVSQRPAKIKMVMLFRNLSAKPSDRIEPAYEAFLKTQDPTQEPYGILLQSEHSRLAGALAGSLAPSAFGQLNTDVIAAIEQHDYGWEAHDQHQMDTLRHRKPQPFSQMNADVTLPRWLSSIAHGRSLGPLAAVLISRHCCLLGTGSGKHADFVKEETARCREIERTLPCSSDDLDRWTAALGFCDLLSLYLCSGSRSTVTLPLAHPEMSAGDREVKLLWVNDQPCLSKPLLKDNARVFATGAIYDGTEFPTRPMPLQWAFVAPCSA